MHLTRTHNTKMPALTRRCHGQAMTEYIIVFPVMLVLIFGTLQFALLYQAKIQLNYAAFEAARSGSLNNAKRWALDAGAVRGMVPLHTHGAGRNWLRWARSKVWDQVNDNPPQLDVVLLNPSAGAFDDHGIDADGERVIPNDHLMYRDSSERGGAGAQISIQDANLIKVRVLYCMEMHVPFVNRMINSLLRLGGPAPAAGNGPSGVVATGQLTAWTNTGVGFNTPVGSFEETCLLRNPRSHIPMMSEATMRMQSAPIFDPVPAPP